MIFTPNSFWGKKHRFWYNFLTACISKGVCSRAFIFLHSIVNDWAISFLPKKVEKNLRKYFFRNFQKSKIFKKKFSNNFFFQYCFRKTKSCVCKVVTYETQRPCFWDKNNLHCPQTPNAPCKTFLLLLFFIQILYALDLWNRLELDAHIFTQGRC